MEQLKNMGLRRSFFLISVFCLAAALLLTYGIYRTCARISDRYPHYGIVITPDGAMTETGKPTPEQERIQTLMSRIQIVSMLMIPISGLGIAGVLIYRLKLKAPITVLNDSK